MSLAYYCYECGSFHEIEDYDSEKICPEEKAKRDNRSNQLNPNNWRYWSSRQNNTPKKKKR